MLVSDPSRGIELIKDDMSINKAMISGKFPTPIGE